ncbi:MAG: hypothetical protein QM783_20170 [Phycisphaerales bacterium]
MTHAVRHACRGSILVAAVVALTVLLLLVSAMALSGGREADMVKRAGPTPARATTPTPRSP